MDARTKLGRGDALRLAAGASSVVVSKGKRVTSFAMKKNPPDEATLLFHMLGPTGNLRSPTVSKGNTLLVGFSEEAYERLR